MDKKRIGIFIVVAAVTLTLGMSSALAKELILFDRPLTLLGYATQGAAVSLKPNADGYYDTEKGLQMALMNLFMEANYKMSDPLKFYTSAKLTVDWAYQLKANDASWHEKEFDKSRNHLNVDDHYWQILNEAHFTWTPGNFFFRLGKQIVSWGETDGFRIMDQINPFDQRHGLGDVEWESTIVPIWLLRSEFYPRISTQWLQDLAFEFVFNFNADHIYDQGIRLGNDDGGIWSPNIRIPDPTAPFGEVRVGSVVDDIDQPGRFNHKGYEYAFRVKGVVYDTIVTLNGFYGYENSPIVKFADPTNPFPAVTVASDGKLILHPNFSGKYPLFRFVGMTASRDLPFLKSSALGNVAPVFRLESFYAYKNTFSDALSTIITPTYNKFKKFDEIRTAVGMDWKVRIRPLNQRAYFFISTQGYLRYVNLDGPEDWYDTAITKVGKYNWFSSLYLSTLYLNAKLTPSFFWLHDFYYGSDMYKVQMTYDWSSNWRFTLGALLFSARDLPAFKANNSFDLFTNKNQLFFKLTYKWS
ncbi:MAG TPA: DUF1302 family protein [Thermodesulfobacteriota bacterium]|nr:DUF1302 family protein [Thermodesulfobacteriota bacterium]